MEVLNKSPSVKSLVQSCESLDFSPEAHHEGAIAMQLLDQPLPYCYYDNRSCVNG